MLFASSHAINWHAPDHSCPAHVIAMQQWFPMINSGSGLALQVMPGRSNAVHVNGPVQLDAVAWEMISCYGALLSTEMVAAGRMYRSRQLSAAKPVLGPRFIGWTNAYL